MVSNGVEGPSDMRRMFKRFAAQEEGVTAIEVSLGAAIVSIVAVVAVESLGHGSVFGYAQAAMRWLLG